MIEMDLCSRLLESAPVRSKHTLFIVRKKYRKQGVRRTKHYHTYKQLPHTTTVPYAQLNIYLLTSIDISRAEVEVDLCY